METQPLYRFRWSYGEERHNTYVPAPDLKAAFDILDAYVAAPTPLHIYKAAFVGEVLISTPEDPKGPK